MKSSFTRCCSTHGCGPSPTAVSADCGPQPSAGSCGLCPAPSCRQPTTSVPLGKPGHEIHWIANQGITSESTELKNPRNRKSESTALGIRWARNKLSAATSALMPTPAATSALMPSPEADAQAAGAHPQALVGTAAVSSVIGLSAPKHAAGDTEH